VFSISPVELQNVVNVFVTCASKLKETTFSTNKNLTLRAICKSSEPFPTANLNNGKPCLPSNKIVCAVTNYKGPNKLTNLQYNMP